MRLLSARLSSKRRSRYAGVVVMLLGLLVTGGAYAVLSPAQADEEAASQSTVDQGRALFLVGCASCHGTARRPADGGVRRGRAGNRDVEPGGREHAAELRHVIAAVPRRLQYRVEARHGVQRRAAAVPPHAVLAVTHGAGGEEYLAAYLVTGATPPAGPASRGCPGRRRSSPHSRFPLTVSRIARVFWSTVPAFEGAAGAR